MHAFMSLQHRDSSFVSSGDPPKSSGTDWSEGLPSPQPSHTSKADPSYSIEHR